MDYYGAKTSTGNESQEIFLVRCVGEKLQINGGFLISAFYFLFFVSEAINYANRKIKKKKFLNSGEFLSGRIEIKHIVLKAIIHQSCLWSHK